jgi:hypothetical protein
MTQKLTVKNEGYPERCEVCHKADYLEANSTICLRCLDIDIPVTLSRFSPHKEEEMDGFFFSFNSTRATRAVASLLALLFSVDIIGLAPTVFFVGGFCSILGVQRLTITKKITSQSILEIVFNLTLIGGGLTCSYFSGLHLLRWIGIR